MNAFENMYLFIKTSVTVHTSEFDSKQSVRVNTGSASALHLRTCASSNSGVVT